MPKLTVTITNEAGSITGQYVIDCVDRPGLNVEAFDSAYTVDLIRASAERHRYLVDFPGAPELSKESATYSLDDLLRAQHLHNVNELWFEIENLIAGARLNFATARMLKDLEDSHNSQSDTDRNAKFGLHLEKLDRFHLGVYELARIEDLIVRIVYEFFGEGFIKVDRSRQGWEKCLTWGAMKDSLKRRGKSDRQPHPNVEAMLEADYQRLMELVRKYRSPKVLELTSYRDRRTHRQAPTVDHPELGVTIQSVGPLVAGQAVPLFGWASEPEFRFIDLYETAKEVYSHVLDVLIGINSIVCAGCDQA